MSVSLCIVTNNCFHSTKYCIDNLLQKTSIKPEILIFRNGCNEERFESYFEDLKQKYDLEVFNSTKELSLAACYNNLIKKSKSKYICIYPVNLLVNKFWLEDLIYNYDNCSNPGAISIRNATEKLQLTSILFSDENEDSIFKHHWVSDKGYIEGIMFFDKEKVKQTDFYDENLEAKAMENIDFSMRVFFYGFLNFYITKQTCYKINVENKVLFPEKTSDGYEKVLNKLKSIVKKNLTMN